MRKQYLFLPVFLLYLTGSLLAQPRGFLPASKQFSMLASNASIQPLGPEVALQKYSEHSREQSYRLTSYESETVVRAELPDTAQQGEYELVASYTNTPRSLSYSSVHFEGDRFVKSNVILKLLKSEVDNVRKGDDGATAIAEQNYKFSYKGMTQVNNHEALVFRLRPRRKVAGLFKGQIYLDANTGSMLRMEGTLVKSPSFFVRNINFVQDFEDINGFTLPTELHTCAQARIVGRTIVNVIHRSYKLHSDSESVLLSASETDTPGANSNTN